MKRKRIDMWKLDPNWKFAEQHGNASRTGIQSSSKDNRKNSIMLCPCCLKIIHKDPVPLCENPKELSFLGYGFPLFYNMLQYCLISLFILILSQSAILLYLSLQEVCVQASETARLLAVTRDPRYPCDSFFVRMARVTSDTSDFEFDRIIRALSFIGQSFLMVYLRDIQRKLAAYHTERNTRIKDFSIIFRDLPKINGIQEWIRSFLLSLKLESKIQIEEIFLIPKIDYFYELENEKKEIIEHIKRNMEAGTFSDSLRDALEAQLERVNLEMLETCKKTEGLYQKDLLFSEKAIVILETKHQKQAVLAKWEEISVEHKTKYFAWMANEVSLTSSPEPREIIWKNINYPKYKRWIRVMIGWVLTILFLAVTTGVFYFLVDFRASAHSVAVLVLTLILIQFFNKFVMKIFLHWFSDIEMPETSSDREFSYAFKYTLGMFFTTAVMSLIVEAAIFSNYQYEYGIVEGETIMFFFNAFIVNLLWITHPQYYIKKFQRWKKRGSKNITQLEANELMEDYPYDMGKRYAQILETMWFTFLYASLIPFGSFLSFLGLCMYYWVDKYNLLRRAKVENTIESKLPLQAVKLMEVTLLWKPLGQLIFDASLRYTVYPESIVMVVMSIVFLFLPWNYILDRFFYEKFNISNETYSEAKYRFTETYQTVDPIQRMLALEKFIENQNQARREMQREKQDRTMLEIRNYDEEISEVANQMVREEVGENELAAGVGNEVEDYSIVLKFQQTDDSKDKTSK